MGMQGYLRTVKIPLLEYKIDKNAIKYRYINVVENFDMPVKAFFGEKEKWLYPTAEWKSEPFTGKPLDFKIDRNFYIDIKKL